MTHDEKQSIFYKEIDLIQSCINRMAQNSFMIKGWLVALLAVILALLPEKFDLNILCIVSFVLIVCLWYLDAFFLKMERLYRWKYNWVIKNRLSSDEVSDKFIFDLNPHNSKMWLININDDEQNSIPPKEPTLLRIMFTKTLILLYGVLALMVIIISLFSLLINYII